MPHIPPSVIGREELVDILDWDDDEAGRAVLVCAPAGYGKTTLLALHAQRLKREDRLIGWMTCDRHDADPAHLWQGVLAALTAAVGRTPAHRRPRDPFGSLTAPAVMDRAFIAELAEAVDALEAPMTLVLDDFHEITDPGTLAGVTDFVRSLPNRLNLIVGTRRDPAISLHRLRLDGRLREVRGLDLAFGRTEVEQVLRGQGVQLDGTDLTMLWRRTEGWPAAVRLASLSLAHDPDPERFVAEFAGDDSAVAGYLVAEILSRLPVALQQFLLDTCVTDDLTAELAATLSGRPDAGALLDGLEQANALVQRLGRSGEWFRYHALLRSYLLAELRRRDLSAARTRHRLAAVWFDDAGLPGSALEHAVAAGDPAMIRALLSRHGIQLLLAGKGSLLIRVIAESPPEVGDDPEVLLLMSIVAFSSSDRVGGDLALARFQALLERGADTGPGAARTRRLLHLARFYQARMHGDTGVLGQVDDRAAAAVRGRRADDDVELLVLVNRGALRIAAGDYPRAKADLRAGLELGRRRGHHRLALDCMNQLTGATGGLSEIRESGEWARRTAVFAAEHGWATSPQLAYSYVVAGWCAYLMLDLEEAGRQVGLAMAAMGGGAIEPEAECAVRSGAAIIAFDRYPQRRSALRDLNLIWDQLHDAKPSPALAAFAQLAEMRMCLILGDRGRAAAVAARADELLSGTGDVAVLHAVELLDHQHHDRARALVAPVLAGELSTVVVTSLITAWLVEALTAAHAGMSETVHRALLTALTIGANTGVMRPFYDFGPPVHELLIAAIGRAGHLEPFLAGLLEAWRKAEAWQEAHAAGEVVDHAVDPHPVLAAPLTAREIEVLRDLPSLLTAEEIAGEHQVSVNTVKTHLRSLYRKLGAANRRDAVSLARRLSLL
ncbi:LuxR C-terminal-related transcriptional regulator [Pseudonocardia sp. DLS-67]